MKIVVCMKQVPDTATRIQIAADGKSMDEKGVTFIVNPYDEFALEEALRLKEARGGEVLLICIGPSRATEAIRTCLAMGADKAIHISDPAAQNSDSLGTARILAKVISSLHPDVILMGKYSIGDDQAQTVSMLSEFLNLPQISGVTHINWQEGFVTARREVEGGVEIVESPLPAVISAQKGLNEPRYPSLKGIMAAKKKEIQEWTLSTLGLNDGQVGLEARKEICKKMVLPPGRSGGKILNGEPEAIVPEMVRLLHQEAKLI